jgi:hypothetical protein
MKKEESLLKVATVKKSHILQMVPIYVDYRMNVAELLSGVERLFWVRIIEGSGKANLLICRGRENNLDAYKTINLGDWDWAFVVKEMIAGVPQYYL